MASRAQNQKTKMDIERLKAKFPRIFDGVKPFEWGVVDDMIDDCPELLPSEIKRAIRHYMHTKAFLKAVIKKKWFRDINSSRTRLITQEEKQKAQRELSAILEIEQRKYSQVKAEKRMAQALAREIDTNFKDAKLVESKSSAGNNQGKVLVITKKPKFKMP